MKDERAESLSIPATDVPLPPERAFVVQLRPRTDPSGELFVGRVEHMVSGAVLRFSCAAELTAFIARICNPRSGSDEMHSHGSPPHTVGKP